MNSDDQFELENVHQVYSKIAPHFSQTRYKPWPVIENFLKNLPNGSLVADVGCGNGKYTSVNHPNVFYVGSDFSNELITLADQKHRHSADFITADNLMLPYKSLFFDHCISVAVIHHFSTKERRLKAIMELMRIVKTGGSILIYVWALEQQKNSKRKFTEQDVMVPWKISDGKDGAVFNRYYHVFAQGELDQLVQEAAIQMNLNLNLIESGYDADNWYVVFQK